MGGCASVEGCTNYKRSPVKIATDTHIHRANRRVVSIYFLFAILSFFHSRIQIVYIIIIKTDGNLPHAI